MPQPKDDLSKSLMALDQHKTLIASIELSLKSWLVGGIVPGIERDPLKKLVPDEEALLKLLHRWRDEAVKTGRTITRIVVAFEAGRDGFWLARWLRARGVEAYVIHPTSIPVSREQRRAKSDRLDIGLLKRAFLGWLRGEEKHCSMAARAVARYAGLTGSPDESGSRRREKGLAKAGNARVRRGVVQLAWRFLIHQKNSTLTQWYQACVAAGKKRTTAAHRALAVCHDRRRPAGRCAAPGDMIR